METTVFTAGNKGSRVRSDCFVRYRKKTQGGIQVKVSSKVKPMYGRQIENLCRQVLEQLGAQHAELEIDDTGALDFTIAARVEAAYKKAHETDKEYLPEMIPENKTQTTKERFRFARLYLPGNNPKMMLNAGVHNSDGIILDLEDSVSPDKKAEARFLVRNALRTVNFYGSERMVRINQLPQGLEDLEYVVPHGLNLILLPKCETADQIKQTEAAVEALQRKHDIDSPVFYMPIIESALGVENAFEIASASNNIAAVAIGLEDYTADLGVQRTNEATESLYARMRLVNACKAAKVQPIDSVFSDVGDEEGLRKTTLVSKSMGYEGMGCIHPRQIPVIQKAFAPTDEEIKKAEVIAEAFEQAEKKGLGVISVGSKMIDPPVVKRALRTMKLARELGLLKSDK